jgi:hypothetical protein
MQEDDSRSGDGLPPVTPEQVADLRRAVHEHIVKKFEVSEGETIPYEELPESLKGKTHVVIMMRDGVMIDHEIKFTWVDRFRIMFGCKLFLHFHIATENVVGRTTVMEGNGHVERFWSPRVSSGRSPDAVYGDEGLADDPRVVR